MSVETIVKGLMDTAWSDNAARLKKLHQYLDWLRTARKGGKFTYHIGLSPQESYIASNLAFRIYNDYEEGLVFPLRIRKGPGIFEFIVIRSSKKV